MVFIVQVGPLCDILLRCRTATHCESACKRSKERWRTIVGVPCHGAVEQGGGRLGRLGRAARPLQGHGGQDLTMGAPPTFSGRPSQARAQSLFSASPAKGRCELARFVDIGKIFCHRQKGVFTPNLVSLFPFIVGFICWYEIPREAYSQISSRDPLYPRKALTALLFTAHSGSQSRNFPQRTLFRHTHRNPPAPISGNRPRPKAP